MDKNQRKVWNENHRILKEIIVKSEKHTEAIHLFLLQHTLLHTTTTGRLDQENLQDSLILNLDESIFRLYPVKNPDTKNSIAWHLWHITRIEDMTMNILVAGGDQVLTKKNWLEQLNIPFEHSGNDMPEKEIAELSMCIDFNALLRYRSEVGRRTQEIISQLEPGQFTVQVEPNRIKQLFNENAITQQSSWLAEYWSKKTIAGLVLMPATRHIFIHLNKCIRIKDRYQKNLIPNEKAFLK